MQKKYRVYSRGKQEISVSFNGKQLSSDGSMVLLEKIERKEKLLKLFSSAISDKRDQRYVKHTISKILKQRVYTMVHGYEDANDEKQLRKDPVIHAIVDSELASQPTISRMESQIDRKQIYKLSETFLNRYVESLKNRKEIVIDVDATDDPTYGKQQLSLFNGFYYQFMYSELLFFDGETQQIILPVLRPGNSHSNKWHVSILKRIIEKIQLKSPNIKITIRADSGFSQPEFYEFAREKKLYYCIGIARNQRLSCKTTRAEKAVRYLFADNGIKHQHFVGAFEYQANSWEKPEKCHAKIESTGRGMNIRYIISNIPDMTSREIYFNFYVKRADTCENRIKELKNMCYSDRLSNHKFWANYFRLILSSIVYEFFLVIRQNLKKTNHTKAHNWQINTIRQKLLKVAATIKHTKRRIVINLAEAFVYKDIFIDLISQ
jgi:hypothetical protein